jgi:hypothetical protein
MCCGSLAEVMGKVKRAMSLSRAQRRLGIVEINSCHASGTPITGHESASG